MRTRGEILRDQTEAFDLIEVRGLVARPEVVAWKANVDSITRYADKHQLWEELCPGTTDSIVDVLLHLMLRIMMNVVPEKIKSPKKLLTFTKDWYGRNLDHYLECERKGTITYTYDEEMLNDLSLILSKTLLGTDENN